MDTPVADWVLQTTTTIGTGPITLSSPAPGYTDLRDALKVSGDVWYSLLSSTGDRECGIGYFHYDTNTLQRTTIHATLKNGRHSNVSPTPIELKGQSLVSCTFNAESWKQFITDLQVGQAYSLPENAEPEVTNTGTHSVPVLNFGIPRGAKGDAATITIGTTTTGDPGTPANVINEGTEHDAVLKFTIPGSAAVSVGSVTTLNPGELATVVDGNPDLDKVVLNFGIPQGVAGLNGTGAVVNTVADLRAAPNNGTATTLGCNAAGDGGGGLWRYDASSNATDNTGTVVKPTSVASNANGRWIRQYPRGTVNARWFGGTWDGVADDTAGVNAALAWIENSTIDHNVELAGPFKTGSLTVPEYYPYYKTFRFSGLWSVTGTITVPTRFTLDGGLGGGTAGQFFLGSSYARIAPASTVSPVLLVRRSAEQTVENVNITGIRGVGIDINGNTRTGVTAIVTALVTLRNVGVDVANVSSAEIPLRIDSAFWVKTIDCSFTSRENSGPCIHITQSTVASGTPNTSYVGLVRFYRTVTNGKGVLLDVSKLSPDVNSSFYFEDWCHENTYTPPITIKGNVANATIAYIEFDNAILADNLSAKSFVHVPDFTGADGTRSSSKKYAVGQRVLWPTGTAVWECTQAGTTASSPPSVSGSPALGDTVTDGTVIWTVAFTQTSVTAIRANSTAYAENELVTWTESNKSVWKCVTAGTTASSAPVITSAIVGHATAKYVTDGTVVWEVIYFPPFVRDVRILNAPLSTDVMQIRGPVQGATINGQTVIDYSSGITFANHPTTQNSLSYTFQNVTSAKPIWRGSDMAPAVIPGTTLPVNQDLTHGNWISVDATRTQTLAPDGSDQAWIVSTTAASGYIYWGPSTYVLGVGDVTIAGVWMRGPGNGVTPTQIAYLDFANAAGNSMQFESGNTIINLLPQEVYFTGNEWRPVVAYNTVRVGGTVYPRFYLRVSTTRPTAFFNPFILHIPAASLSSSEDVIRLVQTITHCPPSATQGDVAVLDHQPLRLGGGVRVISKSAAPTTGTWKRGDVVYNTAPSSAGYVGWVCTSAGTPGTWKTFGLIS